MFFFRFAWEKNVFASPLPPDKALAALQSAFQRDKAPFTGAVTDSAFAFGGGGLFAPRITGRITPAQMKGSEVQMTAGNSKGSWGLTVLGLLGLAAFFLPVITGPEHQFTSMKAFFLLQGCFVLAALGVYVCLKEGPYLRRAEMFLRETVQAEIPEDWKRGC